MAGFGFPSALGSSGLKGDSIFFEDSVLSTPGSAKTIFTVVVGVGVTLNLTQLLATAQFSGIFRVFKDLDLIGSARVNPGDPNIYFSWFPQRPITVGETVKVEFEQLTGTPAHMVDAFLMGAEET